MRRIVYLGLIFFGFFVVKSYESDKSFRTSFSILDPLYDHDQIIIYKFLEKQKHSYIVFIQDQQGKKYVVKQDKKGTMDKQFLAITEVLSAYIAQALGISAEQVQIIPAHTPFPGKFILKRVATLHGVVPGTTVRELNTGKYAKLDIKQEGDTKDLQGTKGFCEKTIYWMSLHTDLPPVVALDTYMGIFDRNKSNLIFDEQANRFYAIDMAVMLRPLDNGRTVVEAACDNVKRMFYEKKVFTDKEVQGLLRYSETLKNLILQFPPSKMSELIDDFFIESNIQPSELFTQKDIEIYINKYKKAIKDAYVVSKDLLYYLYLLTKDQVPSWLKRGKSDDEVE